MAGARPGHPRREAAANLVSFPLAEPHGWPGQVHGCPVEKIGARWKRPECRPLETKGALADKDLGDKITARAFPPPLWGRVREGGRADLCESLQGPTIRGVSATPHPGPPPQGGREFPQPASCQNFNRTAVGLSRPSQGECVALVRHAAPLQTILKFAMASGRPGTRPGMTCVGRRACITATEISSRDSHAQAGEGLSARPRLDHHEGLRQRVLVGDGQVDEGLAAVRRDRRQPRRRAARQPHRRLAGGQIDDAHVAPEHAAPQAGAERLAQASLAAKRLA